MKKLLSLSLLLAVPFCAEAMNDNNNGNKSVSTSPQSLSPQEEWEKSHNEEKKILGAQLNKKDLSSEVGRTIKDQQGLQKETVKEVCNNYWQEEKQHEAVSHDAINKIDQEKELRKAVAREILWSTVRDTMDENKSTLSSFQQYAASEHENAQQKAAALEHLKDIFNGNEQDTQKSLKKLQATMLNNSEEDSSSGDSGDDQFYNLSSDFSDTDEIIDYLTKPNTEK